MGMNIPRTTLTFVQGVGENAELADMKRYKGADIMKYDDGEALPVSSVNGRTNPYKLLPFQRIGVEYIKERKYSLLADDMGL